MRSRTDTEKNRFVPKVVTVQHGGVEAVISRRRAWGTAGLLVLVILGSGVRLLLHTPWYMEQHWSHRTLADLVQEQAHHADDPVFLYYLGLRLDQGRRFAAAEPLLERAAGLEPNAARIRDAWARAQLGNGQVTAAFAQLHQFVGTHPDSAEGHLALGKFYLTRSSLLSATGQLEQAVHIAPDNVEAWSNLATGYTNSGDPIKARDAEERAVGMLPNSGGERLKLAVIYAKLGLVEQAHRAYQQACVIAPNRTEVHIEYAHWLLDHPVVPNNQVLAETEARHAIALSPTSSEANFLLGRSLVQQRRDAEAVQPLLHAFSLDATEPEAPLMLAQVFNRRGQTADAKYWQGIYLVNQQRVTRRQMLLEKVEAHPENIRAQHELARALADWGDEQGCLQHEAALQHATVDAPAVLVAAAQDMIAVGRQEEALPLLGQALTSTTLSPATCETLGDTWLALGRLHDAGVAYDRAIVYWPQRRSIYKARLMRSLQHLRRPPRNAGAYPPTL